LKRKSRKGGSFPANRIVRGEMKQDRNTWAVMGGKRDKGEKE